MSYPIDRLVDDLAARAAALEAENDRLREALRAVMDEYHSRIPSDPEDMALLPFRMKEIALTALASGPKSWAESCAYCKGYPDQEPHPNCPNEHPV